MNTNSMNVCVCFMSPLSLRSHYWIGHLLRTLITLHGAIIESFVPFHPFLLQVA